MAAKRFIAKKGVEQYFTDKEYGSDNIWIDDLLKSHQRLSGWVKSLDFLNLIHEFFAKAQALQKKPILFVETVKALSTSNYLKLIVRKKHFFLQTTKDEEWFRFTMQSLICIALLKLLRTSLSINSSPGLVPIYKLMHNELGRLKASENLKVNIGVAFPEIDIPEIAATDKNKNEKNLKRNISESLTFEDLFENNSDYQKIIDLIAAKNWIDIESLRWIYESSGGKTLLASLIKNLPRLGYPLRKNRITNPEVVVIAKNSFHCHFKIGTAKKAKYLENDLKFLKSRQVTTS